MTRPSEHIVTYLDQLPSVSTLPESFRHLLSDIADLSPPEKLTVIHSFVNGYMSYEPQDALTEKLRTFEDILRNPTGDCDDYAMFAAALLDYAGFDRSSVISFGADVEYQTNGATILRGLHALTAVPQGTPGTYYILDMNCDNVFVLDESEMQADISLSLDGANDNGTILIKETYLAFTSSGEVLKARPIPEELRQPLSPDPHRPVQFRAVPRDVP